MSDIFISYATGDRQVAQQFARALEASGWSVWWDREIPVGKNFDQVIEGELNAARCVVVLWSRNSVKSRWVKTESSAAADRDRLVPVLIDDAAIPLEFKRIQTAMLPHWDGDTANPEFQRLARSVRELVGRTAAVEPVAPRENRNKIEPPATPWLSPRLLSASAVLLLVVAGLIFAKRGLRDFPPETAVPASNDTAKNVSPASPSNPNSPPGPSQTASDMQKAASPKGPFPIKIGDRIDDGVPAPGAGRILVSPAPLITGVDPLSVDPASPAPVMLTISNVNLADKTLAELKVRLATAGATKPIDALTATDQPNVYKVRFTPPKDPPSPQPPDGYSPELVVKESLTIRGNMKLKYK